MRRHKVTINGKTYDVDLIDIRNHTVSMNIEGCEYEVLVTPPDAPTQQVSQPENKMQSTSKALYDLHAPMPGIISRILHAQGETVPANTPLVVIEAMKMENPVCLPNQVVIDRIHVAPGEEVAKGLLLISCLPSKQE